ncbi:MAG: hypothetical protein ABJC24_08040 [Chloroflexota bacterium]
MQHDARDVILLDAVNVIDWLLDSDPSVRWQVLQDLADAPAPDVARERSRVATDGWGAELLARQTADGRFGGDTAIPKWTSSREWHCLMTLTWLRDMGLDPQSAEARRAVALVRDNVTWHWWDDNPFFVGEVEPCINGRVAAIGAYFGQDSQPVVDRLLGEQMADGGWNCEQENGSTRASFHTTINVLEGLLEHERANGTSAELTAARERGREYLLERRLLRRLSSGEIVDPDITRMSFPTSYHYDVLRALDYLRAAAIQPDTRMDEAIGIVRSKRDGDGRWPLENPHPDLLEIDMSEREGEPSRWNTLRAMRVLRWYEGR